MINFQLYIDISGGKDPDGWFEIDAIISPFTSEDIPHNPYDKRIVWGDLRIKNKPYSFTQLGDDRYRLYTIIKSQEPTQEIRLRFVSAYQTIEGYFGTVDCKIDDDQKTITVKVTTLDQYTELIENSDIEVKLFDETNQVINGNFEVGTDNRPTSWDFNNWVRSTEYMFLEKKYINSKSAIAISDTISPTHKGSWDAGANIPYLVNGVGEIGDTYFNVNYGVFNGVDYFVDDSITYNGSVWVRNNMGSISSPLDYNLNIKQTVKNIIKGRQLNLSFSYALSGNVDKRFDLAYSISIYDKINPLLSHRLQSDGTWGNSVLMASPTLITYKTGAYGDNPLDSVELIQYKLGIAKAPIDGNIVIVFYRFDSDVWEAVTTKLLLTDIILSASAIELKTITIELPSEYLVTASQGSDIISYKKKRANEVYFYNWDKEQNKTLESMFNVDESPNLNAMLMSSGIKDGFKYVNIISSYANDQLSPSYKFELSKITVFRGDIRGNVFAGHSRNYYGVAEFSREEIYIADEFIDGKYIPPSEGDWFRTGTPHKDNAALILWVRTPFNGIAIPWKQEPKETGELRASDYGFNYIDSITSVKQYPVKPDATIKINNGIDLRELIQKVYRETHTSLRGKNVYSNFLWNDQLTTEQEVALNSSPNVNYLTGKQNTLDKIVAIHTNEFSTQVDTDKDKTILKTTFKKLMDDLLVLLPECYAFIDANGDLHIEHLKFFDAINTAVSLVNPKYKYLGDYRSWEYSKDKMFAKEEYTIVNSGYTDFKTATVTFDKIVSNKRGETAVITHATQFLTTDVRYCAENPDNLDNGVLLVTYAEVDGINKAKYGLAQRSGKIAINGDLSLPSLLSVYATYEGVWEKGQLNDKPTSYQFTKRSRQGKEITLKGIFTDKVILTDLGMGITRPTFDYQNEVTKIVANYRYRDVLVVTAIDELVDFGGELPVEPTAPTMGALIINSVNVITVDLTYAILSDGNSPITAHGVCWEIKTTPDIDGAKTVNTTNNLITNEKISVDPVGFYYIRAYATNAVGTTYSEMKKFLIQEHLSI